MDSARGGLALTVLLVFLLIFCLVMPGQLRWIAAGALVLNLRWWVFLAKPSFALRAEPGPTATSARKSRRRSRS